MSIVCLAFAWLAYEANAWAADVPSPKQLYEEGPGGRYLVDGGWLLRRDDAGQGLSQRWPRQTSTAGWSPVTVPNAWNVGDETERSLAGSVAWYRKDFDLPDQGAGLAWALRFESVNYRARVWLNGREIGSHTGAAVPFTLLAKGMKATGNRLVVRVDSRRRGTDFPPFRLSSRGTGTGGWWNYGGILREVYLERLDTAAIQSVAVLPKLACTSCTADVDVALRLRSVSSGRRRLSARASFDGRSVRLGAVTLAPGRTATLRNSFRLARPQLWSPGRPHLYPVQITVSAGGRTVGTYSLRVGVRSLRISSTGRLYLNGRPVNVRGVGVHEDNRTQGFAVDNVWRRQLVSEAQAVGARMLRTHYPLHPYIHELADREGLLIWSEIPVYQMAASAIRSRSVRARALRLLQDNVRANVNHPSVAVWSIGNELSPRPDAGQARYIREAAAAARAIDPTRPVGIAFAGYPSERCHRAAYAPLDILGVNDYFGWYPGPDGRVMDRDNLSPYLDKLRRCYRREALMVTEFGAEANRDGPSEEKGTWQFQREWVDYHLRVFASKPWLSGAVYWALNEFRIKPDWEGGNPRPAPPIHQKGLLTYDSRARKPAWEVVQRWFSQTQQF
jgi:beta-glucuronidase